MPNILLLTVTLLMLVACHQQAAPTIDMSASRYFEQTGYAVHGEFLYFFELYGGVESLGYPLTGEIITDGWTMQYFERGRLERHPENEPRYRVTVGWLGEILNRQRPPIPTDFIPPTGGDRLYFVETGHTISGDFRHFFEMNGEKVRFGLPISEPFLLDGQIAQDFQSTRFFWTPLADSPVTLEKIGQLHLNMRQ
jgi:hypothetical protein